MCEREGAGVGHATAQKQPAACSHPVPAGRLRLAFHFSPRQPEGMFRPLPLFQPSEGCFSLFPAPRATDEVLVVASLSAAEPEPGTPRPGPLKVALAANRYYELEALDEILEEYQLPPATPGFRSTLLPALRAAVSTLFKKYEAEEEWAAGDSSAWVAVRDGAAAQDQNVMKAHWAARLLLSSLALHVWQLSWEDLASRGAVLLPKLAIATGGRWVVGWVMSGWHVLVCSLTCHLHAVPLSCCGCSLAPAPAIPASAVLTQLLRRA